MDKGQGVESEAPAAVATAEPPLVRPSRAGQTRRRPKRARPSPGRLLTRTELAVELGKNPGTIIKWQELGMPVAVRGGKGVASKYRMAEIWEWGLEQERTKAGAGRDGTDLNLPIEHAKLKRAQRLKLEADERRKSGETLERADVARTVGQMIQAIRSGVLRLPQAMASQVVALVESGDGTTEVEAALTGACRDILRELAAWKEQEELIKEAATG